VAAAPRCFENRTASAPARLAARLAAHRLLEKRKEVTLRERFTKKKRLLPLRHQQSCPKKNEKWWHMASPRDLARLVVAGDAWELAPAESACAKGLALVKEGTVRCTPRTIKRHALQTLPQTV